MPGQYKSKGPLGTVVRLASAAQAITFPVTSGEAFVAGRIRVVEITARIISDGTSRNLQPLINGSATNVTKQNVNGIAAAAAANQGAIGLTDVYGCFVTLKMFTGKAAAGLKRMGQVIVGSNNVAGPAADTIFVSHILFSDTATIITSIGLDCGFATGLAIGSEGFVTEYEI